MIFESHAHYEDERFNEEGDSLWKIAANILGNGSRYKEIMQLSGISCTTIYAGQVLTVPVA